MTMGRRRNGRRDARPGAAGLSAGAPAHRSSSGRKRSTWPAVEILVDLCVSWHMMMRHFVMGAGYTTLPVGQPVSLPGHFDVPVVLEAARPLGKGFECRIRLP